ncbi:MAG: phosphohydrolase [Methylococcaceae bacterium]|nr:phosphohydrolase [Methylococcaceae bacterium]
MTPITLGIISICAYLTSTTLLIQDALKNSSRKKTTLPAWLAVFLHIGYTFSLFMQQSSFNFSLFNTASIISSLVAFLLLLASITNPVEKLGLAVFPLASIALLSTLIFPGKELNIQISNWQMSTHILSSIIAFSLLNIAALQAIMLAIQESQLKNHPPQKFIRTLPPLQTMETLLFQMIGTGLLFLSISLVSGFIFIEDLFAQHLAHKTILAIVAWITFSGLLTGRIKYGWRGQTAVKWTLAGFTLLLLAYFGSKLVLELILQKT